MKKLFSILPILTLGISSIAFATSDFTPFTTVKQAQEHCPAVNGLTFTPNIPTIPNGAGTITGNNRVAFESIPAKTAIRPKEIDSRNLIQNVEMRSADGLYGYISNNTVTCLYSYTTIKDVQYALVTRGK